MPLKACGTNAAYTRHFRNGEEPCDPCRKAHAEVTRAERERNRIVSAPQPKMPCGTYASYNRHIRNGEEPCGPCREASCAYQAKRKRNPVPKAQLKPCGTPAAYNRHLRNGEEPCDPCRKAAVEMSNKARREKNMRTLYEPWAEKLRPLLPSVDSALCSSVQGFLAHMDRDEYPCVGCVQSARKFLNRHSSPESAKNGEVMKEPTSDSKCGTQSGYSKHRRRKEEACKPCKRAQAEYMRERRARPRENRCGTMQGYKEHLKARENPCSKCLQACLEESTQREGDA